MSSCRDTDVTVKLIFNTKHDMISQQNIVLTKPQQTRKNTERSILNDKFVFPTGSVTETKIYKIKNFEICIGKIRCRPRRVLL